MVKTLGKGDRQLESVALNRNLYEQLLRDVLIDNANRVVELYEGHGSNWQVSKCGPMGRSVLRSVTYAGRSAAASTASTLI